MMEPTLIKYNFTRNNQKYDLNITQNSITDVKILDVSSELKMK